MQNRNNAEKVSPNVFDLDTPIVSKTRIACRIGTSVDAVENAAAKLGIKFQKTLGGHDLGTLREAQQVAEYIERRKR